MKKTRGIKYLKEKGELKVDILNFSNALQKKQITNQHKIWMKEKNDTKVQFVWIKPLAYFQDQKIVCIRFFPQLSERVRLKLHKKRNHANKICVNEHRWSLDLFFGLICCQINKLSKKLKKMPKDFLPISLKYTWETY